MARPKKRERTVAEKMIDNLETIKYQGEQLMNIKYILKANQEIMKLQLEAITFLMLSSGKNTGVCEKYGKEFETKIKQLGLSKGWSFYAEKKEWVSQ